MSLQLNFRPYFQILRITIAGFIVMVVGLVVLERQLNDEITKLTAQTANLYHHPFRVNAAARDARFAITKIRAENLTATLSPESLEHTTYQKELIQSEALLDKSLSIIEESFLGDMEKVREARELARVWHKDRAELINLIINERNAEATYFIKTKATPIYEALQVRVDYIVDFSSKKAEELVKQAQDRSKFLHVQLRLSILGFAIFMLTVGGTTAVLVLKSLYQRDMSLRQAHDSLRIAATIFESQEGMFITDTNSVILRVNHAFTRITGYSAEEAIGKTPSLFKSGQQDKDFYASMWKSLNREGYWAGEILNRRKSGEVYPEQLTITTVKDASGIFTNYVATLTDISERKGLESELTKQAHLDYLTGLSNRRHFMAQAEVELSRAIRYDTPLSLLMLDIDFFKNVNDTYGHQVGDIVLQVLSKICQDTLRQIDVVGRLGGEEFAVILPETTIEDAIEVAERLRESVAKMEVKLPLGLPIHFMVSIGITTLHDKNVNIDMLLNQADKALYEAKETGRNKVCVS